MNIFANKVPKCNESYCNNNIGVQIEHTHIKLNFHFDFAMLFRLLQRKILHLHTAEIEMKKI